MNSTTTTTSISGAGKRFFVPALCAIFALCLTPFAMLAQTSAFDLAFGTGTGQASDYSWDGTHCK